MNIKATGKDIIFFSYWTFCGLGHEKTVAIYFHESNSLQIHTDEAKHIHKILKALRNHRAKNKEQYDIPVEVKYW